MRMIAEIRKQIRLAMEKGESIDELDVELKEAIVSDQAEKLIKEDAEIVSLKLQTRERATKLVTRANTQREAIKAFLQARNEVVAPIRKAIEKAKDLPKLEDACWAEFHDMMIAGSCVSAVDGQLPADFTFPMLELGNGQTHAYDKAKEAFMYLQYANGILTALHLNEVKAATQNVKDPYGVEK